MGLFEANTREARLGWYGHVGLRRKYDSGRRMPMMELPGKGKWEGQKEVYGCGEGVTTIEELQWGIDKKNSQYDVIVLDFQKAFDKVSHHHLLRNLHTSGVRGKLHK